MKTRDLLIPLLSASVLAGCATTATTPEDPWEGMNRSIYAFNDKADRYALKPVAQGYQAITPLPARTGISNFFGNISDVWTGFNNLLQGKPGSTLTDLSRFAVNTTVGILGLFDVATEVGLEKHDEDFGQTLAVWGVPDGPYLVLPLFGPSNVRDAGGLVVDRAVFNINYAIESVPVRNSVAAVHLVNTRASLLGAETTLEDASLDSYVFMRTFYMQHRRSEIYDGHPPVQKREDDFYDGSSLPAEPVALLDVYPRGMFDLMLVSPEPAVVSPEPAADVQNDK
jgi:phospholipid-binding lipoprotein MlaA